MAAVCPSSATVYTVTLEGGQPWGIRLQGGYEFAQKLRIARVNPNSKAYDKGVQMGDLINSINGQSTDQMNHRDALRLFQNANNRLILELTRSDKQSAIPILRVESPTGSRNSDSELLGGNQHIATMPSFKSSHHDDIGRDVTSGLETNAGQLSHTQPASVMWSPMEILDLQSKNQLLPEHPSGTVRRRRSHNISDPGFAPKHSLRPPISDSIQLLRRSRQFNFWTHLYPRNFSEPCIVTPTEPASDSSRQSRPPVFTSVDEFQKHYGSCYARTMPVRKRLPVRSPGKPSSAPSSPQMKRAQFARTDNQLQPLRDDSTGFLSTISRVSQGNTNLVSSCTLSDNSLNVEANQENHLDFYEPEPLPTSLSQSDQSLNKPPDSVTSSLTVRLAVSDGDKRKKEEMTKETAKTGWKTANKLAEDSGVRIIRNAEALVKKLPSFGTTSSSDMNFGLPGSILSPSFGSTSTKLEMIRSEQPAAQSAVQSLYKNSGDVETWKNKKFAKISIRSTAKDSKHEMPSYNNSDTQLTDARQDISDYNSLEAEFLLNQRDWYQHVFKELHKVDKEPELPLHVMDKAEAVIPPRPKNTQNLDAAFGQNQSSDTINAQYREKCRMAKKGVEIPPCGLRFISKPGRPDQNSEFKLNKPFSEGSSSSVSDHLSQEVCQTSRSMDLDLKRAKTAKIYDNEQLLSPRFPAGTRKKDVDSLLYTDKYWLELAGLAKTDNREPAVIHRQAQADKVAAKPSTKSLPCKAVALYSFKAKSEKELSFEQGDIIYLIRPIDKNWFEAEHNGAVGFVPSNYIKVTAGSEEAREKSFGKAIAKHSFTAKFPSELSFEKGDILTVLRCIDGNWFEGKLDQQTGIFPISYVEPFTVPVTSFSRVNPSAGLDSPISVSTRSSVLSTTVPSGPASPLETYTSDYNPLDLEKSIFEFDKLVKNSQNLDIIKKDQSSNRGLNGGIAERVPVFLGFDISLAECKPAANPKCNLKTTCDLVVNDGKIASGMTQMQDPGDQSINSELLKDTGSKVEAVRSATPSLHLLYEEPWYQVLYNYKPQHDDELDLREGDLIYLLERCDDGWCVGQSDRTKRVGTFPRNYVTQLG